MNVDPLIANFKAMIASPFVFVKFIKAFGLTIVDVIAIFDNCMEIYDAGVNIYDYILYYWKNPMYWLGQIGLNFLNNLLDFIADMGNMYTYMDEGNFFAAGEISGAFFYNVIFEIADPYSKSL